MKGKFYHCEGDNDVLDKSGCENSTGKWVKYRYNFDNLGSVRCVLSVNTFLIIAIHSPFSNYLLLKLLFIISYLPL